VENEKQETIFNTSSNEQESAYSRDSSAIQEDERITESLLSPIFKEGGSLPTVDQTRSLQQWACPECDRHLIGLETHSVNDQLIHVDINSVAKSDQLLIETEQSTYVFIVSDPTMRWGKLTGGILGNRLLPAYLLPAERELEASTNEFLISVGEKVRFVFESGNHIERLVTSSVTRVVRIREQKAVAGDPWCHVHS
jgi:hypothetical protein